MKTYKCQVGKPTSTEFKTNGWVDVEAPSMIEAAGIYLQTINPTVGDYPLMVYVSDGKLLYPNGAPMCVHGYVFQLDIVENKTTKAARAVKG